MRTPEPPPLPPGPKMATTDGLTFSMTAMRSSSAFFSAGSMSWAGATAARLTATSSARIVLVMGWVSAVCRLRLRTRERSRKRRPSSFRHLGFGQGQVFAQVEQVAGGHDDLHLLHVLDVDDQVADPFLVLARDRPVDALDVVEVD